MWRRKHSLGSYKSMLKNTGHYIWTSHVQSKMQFYRLSESKVKQIIRHPERIEEGIVPDTVAVMKAAGTADMGDVSSVE